MNLFTIRGTNGSGKSFVVRQFLNSDKDSKIIVEDKDQVTHLPSLNLYVLGKYSEASTGGLDTVSSFDRIKELALKYLEKGHVIMEGLLWSGVYKTPHEFDIEVQALGHTMYWIYVDTPYEKCVDQIMARRAKYGNADPFNPKNVLAKHNSSIQAFNKAVRDKHVTWYADSSAIQEVIHNILNDHVTDLPNKGKILLNSGQGKYEGVKLVEQINHIEVKPNNSSNLLDFT